VTHRRRGRSRLLLLSAAVVLLAACSNDSSAYPHAGTTGGWVGSSFVRGVLLYVLVPVAIGLVVAALVAIPSARNRRRYRPSEGWDADPVWFAGPADPVGAVAQASVGDVVRGGAGGSW
jgi:hypothetical protein